VSGPASSRLGRWSEATLGRYLGPFPTRGASNLERLIWFRRFWLRTLPLPLAAVILLAIIGGDVIGWTLVGVWTGTWLVGFAGVHSDLWRERRRQRREPTRGDR